MLVIPRDAVEGTDELPGRRSLSYWRSLLMSVGKHPHVPAQSPLHNAARRKRASFAGRAERAKRSSAAAAKAEHLLYSLPLGV